MAISKNRIQVKNYGYAYEERDAGAAGIYPGMLCKVDTDGDVIQHATEGGRGEISIALEDGLQGKLVSEVYVVDNPVRLMTFRPAEEFCGLLALGETVVIGDGLVSGGDGTFVKDTNVSSGVTVNQVMAVALEAETAAANVLIHMRAV